MARLFTRKSTPIQTTLEVTCPNCGRVASFPSGTKVAEPKTLVCKSCHQDLRKEYLTLAVQEQIEQQKTLRLRLYLVSLLALVSVVLMAYITSRAAEVGFWHYLLLGIGGFLFLGCIILILLNQQQIGKLKKLAADYHLPISQK